MHRPPHIVRRTALGLLAAWPLGVTVRRARAGAPLAQGAAAAPGVQAVATSAAQRVFPVVATQGASAAAAEGASAAIATKIEPAAAAQDGSVAAPAQGDSAAARNESVAAEESRPAGTSIAATRQAAALAHAAFTDSQGASHRLSELTRPLVLVNLWAAWCTGCLEELPTIRALAALLGPDAIDVVLLSHAMNWQGDQAYARRTAMPFRHWRLSAREPESVAAAAFRIEADRFALPQTLVFAGRDRALVRSLEGSQDWAAPDQVRLARTWLAAR